LFTARGGGKPVLVLRYFFRKPAKSRKPPPLTPLEKGLWETKTSAALAETDW